MLQNNEFIEYTEEIGYYLTSKGIIASNIHECHCLILGDFIYSGKLDDLSCKELVSFFSCFTNITIIQYHLLFIFNTTK